ncbi:response regulator transcription factor [Sulfurimonas sp. MAG313]|nr:response regulator transcription factor [Sulfurimonas sp. MAG313]MDF1880666.1 response regulator transcription factor [Sulfurimonas sp. MAG313]
MKILIVEDDIKISAFIKKGLQEESYSVDTTFHGDEAIYLAQVNDYDVILLDLMIPGCDGISVCKHLRAKEIQTPIIMLTSKNTLEDKINGLDSGASDYLTKPFAFEELLARIRVQLRDENSITNVFQVLDLTLDTKTRIVKRSNNKIKLTMKEYVLLELLMRNAHKLLSETIIKENIMDMNQESMSNIINVYMYRLRSKIDKGFEKKLIHTIRGSGYILSDEDV